MTAKASAKIPVSCVEQGRWYHTSAAMKTDAYATPRVRSAQSRSAGRALRTTGRATSDQHEVWACVASSLDELACESPTGALKAAVEQRGDDLDAFLKALPCPALARGVIVAIAGKFVALDLFDRAETLAKLWPRLVRAYALDALCQESAFSGPRANGIGLAAAQILEQMRSLDCTPCPSPGLGQDWRFEAAELAGSALVVDDVCMRLSAFPTEGGTPTAQTRSGRISRPSQRRRIRGR